MSKEINLSVPAAEALLAAMPTDVLWNLFKSPDFPIDTFFRGGYQISRKSIQKPAVRSRIAHALSRDADFAELFLKIPDPPWAQWVSIFAVFEERWLRKHWRHLVRSGGGISAAVALALDERASLHSRGVRTLSREGIWKTSPQSEPTLGNILADLLPFRPEETPTEHKKGADGLSSIKPCEKQESRELRDVRKSLDTHRGKLKDLRTELKALAADAALREKQLQGEVRAEKAKMAKLEATATQQIQNAIAEIRRNVLRVSPELVTSAQTSAASTDELIVRAEAALARQSEINERQGLLSGLRNDLNRLTAISECLKEAIHDSLSVLPETKNTFQAVMAERQRITEVLNEFSEYELAEDSFSTYLLACIRGFHLTATEDPGLDAIEDLLRHDLIQEFIGPDSLSFLRSALRERRVMLADLTAASNRNRNEHRTEPDEIWNVNQALLKARENAVPVRLFVDGYNAIRRVEALAARENDGGLAVARDALVALCKGMAERFTALEVVFDGSGTLTEHVADSGVTVIYTSAVAETQNADIYLTARLHALNTSDCSVWLVTDDFGLRNQVRSCCDAYIAPIHFYSFLAEK